MKVTGGIKVILLLHNYYWLRTHFQGRENFAVAQSLTRHYMYGMCGTMT